ncbi:hypothetical protein Tco_0511403 [Tanacetum coccineum]
MLHAGGGGGGEARLWVVDFSLGGGGLSGWGFIFSMWDGLYDSLLYCGSEGCRELFEVSDRVVDYSFGGGDYWHFAAELLGGCGVWVGMEGRGVGGFVVGFGVGVGIGMEMGTGSTTWGNGFEKLRGNLIVYLGLNQPTSR